MQFLSAVHPHPLAIVPAGVALTDGVGVKSAPRGLRDLNPHFMFAAAGVLARASSIPVNISFLMEVTSVI
jgi:hypothetical protein